MTKLSCGRIHALAAGTFAALILAGCAAKNDDSITHVPWDREVWTTAGGEELTRCITDKHPEAFRTTRSRDLWVISPAEQSKDNPPKFYVQISSYLYETTLALTAIVPSWMKQKPAFYADSVDACLSEAPPPSTDIQRQVSERFKRAQPGH